VSDQDCGDCEALREAQALFFEVGMRQRMVVAQQLARMGLTFVQAHALRLLDPDQPLPMHELARKLEADASNVTGLTDRLERLGLVERRPDPADRRVRVLALTPHGAQAREVVLRLMTEPPAAFAALPPEDHVTLRDIMRRAAEHLRRTQESEGRTPQQLPVRVEKADAGAQSGTVPENGATLPN
jgi:DNA-binding MarR family transcriptional regulator